MERKAPRRRVYFLQNTAEMDGTGTRWPPPAPPDHRQDGNPGEVYKPEGQSLFPLLRNSPPRLHVPFSVSISTFHLRIQLRSHASYQQVKGMGGVVLNPGRKNETVKIPRPKNKNFGGRKRHICEGEVRPLCSGSAWVAAGC